MAAQEEVERLAAKRAAKAAQKAAASKRRRANERERARICAAAPGYSLPALRELDLTGCFAFGTKGLDRLLANAPMVRNLFNGTRAHCPTRGAPFFHAYSNKT